MKKNAQERSLLNKLHDKINVPGKAVENIFNPEFKRVMDSLRSVDADIRSIIGGKSIEDGDPGNDDVSMKNLIKEARKNFNRREYMTSVAFLGRFHKKANDIVNRIEDLNIDVNQIHEDFLFKELDSDQIKHLQDLKTRFANMVVRDSLIKQAGLRDTLHNIFDERGRALAAWEKRYPKQVKKLKKDTLNILSKSEQLLNSMLANLKPMATFRASRKPDHYLKAAKKISTSFNKYHELFQSYYNDNIKGFLDNQQFENPPVKENNNEEVIDSEVLENETDSTHDSVSTEQSYKPTNTTPISLINPLSDTEMSVPESQRYKSDVISDEIRKALQPAKVPPEAIGIEPPKAPDNMKELNHFQFSDPPEAPDSNDSENIKKSHYKFIKKLESLGEEDPNVMALYINKYANLIKTSDTVTYSRLKLLANKITRG